MSKAKLFVYGTLKRYENADITKLFGGKFIKEVKLTGYDMYISDHNYPFVMEVGGDSSIIGELFEIESSHIPYLDMYEGYEEGREKNLFVRKTIQIDGEDVYIYVVGNIPIRFLGRLHTCFCSGVLNDD